MTARLTGGKTFFPPFNRGSHPGEVQYGAGNPQHHSGYRSGYFRAEVLERESFFDILGHFIFIEKKEEKVEDGKGGSRIKGASIAWNHVELGHCPTWSAPFQSAGWAA